MSTDLTQALAEMKIDPEETTYLSLQDYENAVVVDAIIPPKKVSCVSILEDRSVHPNSFESLRELAIPPNGLHLTRGFSDYKRRCKLDPHNANGHPNRLDRILRMILDRHSSADLMQHQVVTWRGIMRKILQGHYLQLNVSFYREVLYIEEYDPAPNKVERIWRDAYIGQEFESVCGGEAARPNLHARWYLGVTRNFGDIRVLITGEVDCIRGQTSQELEGMKYVEVKSKKIGSNIKWLDWYMQCSLIGVQELIVGFHDNGVLRRTESILVDEIPMKYLNKKQDYFESMFHNAHKILNTLREFGRQASEAGDISEVVWRVETLPGKETLRVRQLSTAEKQKIDGKEIRIGILPTWYCSSLDARFRAAEA